MKNLDTVLAYTLDAQWHAYDEVMNKTSLPSDQLNMILAFLEGQGFIERKNDMIKITSRGLKYLELPV